MRAPPNYSNSISKLYPRWLRYRLLDITFDLELESVVVTPGIIKTQIAQICNELMN